MRASLAPPNNGQTARKIGRCFVKGVAAGAVTAVAVGAVAAVAAPVSCGSSCRSGDRCDCGYDRFGTAAVAGAVAIGVSAGTDISNQNWSEVAYDAGSVVGGPDTGFGTGAATAGAIDRNATPGWSRQSGRAQAYNPKLGSFAQWMGTGPTHALAGLANAAAVS